MGVSSFVRFKGGFPAPREEDGPEALRTVLEQPAAYLATELRAMEVDCSPPEWCDFEYEIPCTVGRRVYRLSVSFDYLKWEWFEVSYQPTLGPLARLLGRTEAPEMGTLSHAVDAILRRREGLLDLRWYAKPLGDPERDYARDLGGVPV